jgi:hypothetical protein
MHDQHKLISILALLLTFLSAAPARGQDHREPARLSFWGSGGRRGGCRNLETYFLKHALTVRQHDPHETGGESPPSVPVIPNDIWKE